MNRRDGNNSQELAILAVAICLLGVGLYVGVAAPTLVWSALHGEPTLVGFRDAIGGGLGWIANGADGDARGLSAFRAYRDVMPAPGIWVAMNVGLLIILVLAFIAALVRLDRWRGSRPVGLPQWHPRNWVTPRSWARPRAICAICARVGGA